MKMKKIFKLEFIGSLASVIALIFFVYYQFIYEDNSILEIKIINKEELTKIPTDNNLEVKYSLNGRNVTNLHKIRFSIKNIGNKTIIGKENIGLLTEPLPLILNGDAQLYGINITDKNFPIEIIKTDSLKRSLSFKQWRKGEFIELSAYLNNSNYTQIKGFSINERDIIDGTIIISEFKNEELTREPKLIDKLPLKLQNISWWILIIAYVVAYLLSFWQYFVQIKTDDIRSSKVAMISFTLMWLILNILLLIPLLYVI